VPPDLRCTAQPSLRCLWVCRALTHSAPAENTPQQSNIKREGGGGEIKSTSSFALCRDPYHLQLMLNCLLMVTSKRRRGGPHIPVKQNYPLHCDTNCLQGRFSPNLRNHQDFLRITTSSTALSRFRSSSKSILSYSLKIKL